MSFQTTAIKYGWMYLTALGVITGTTIYVANNTRKQVLPVDIIQIPLAVTERALALQYGTNALGEPLYYVDPPSFVRTWTSNVYTTNGVTVYTNIVTNTIGWHTDRTMMVSLDATIKALVPYYVDTNTVYDGTTNIAMLTVTGLWASLGIGDGTNKFTRTPAWTNPVSTNWVVSYTNFQVHGYPYWVLTNTYFSSIITNDDDVIIKDVQQEYWYWFGTTNLHICYTSSLDEAVYAVTNIIKESYFVASVSNIGVITNFFAERVGTLPGYYISNFPQVVSQTTNAATYGDYPWQIYVEDLQERYKVLEALKMTAPSDYSMVATNQIGGFAHNHLATNVSVWAALKASIDTNMAGPPTAFIGTFTFATATSAHEPNTGIWAEPDAWKQVWKDSTFSWSNITVLDGTMFWFVSMTNMTGDDFGVPYVTNNFVTGYDANGIPNPLNGQLYIWGEEVVAASNGVIFSVNLSSDATWCVAPSWNTGWTHWNWRIPFPSDPYVTLVSTRGCKLREHKAVFQPTFLYCVDKYW